MKTTITIKNYRCFVEPVTIEIAKGFVAFVGMNNAGKSTLMRFLLEFRGLFESTNDTGRLTEAFRGSYKFKPIHVLDNLEIFSNLNELPIELTFEFRYETAVF